MKYQQLVLKQWPGILYYLGLLGILWAIFELYNLPRIILWDIIRYTWFIVIAVLLGHAAYQLQQIKQLNKLQQHKVIPKPHFRNPVLQAYSQSLQEVQQQKNSLQKNLEQRLLTQQDYLKIWSHEMKTPLMTLSALADNQTQIASNQVQQQIALIQNKIDLLLNYERLADFNHDLDFQWLDVNQLLKPIIKKYAIFFATKHLNLHNVVNSMNILTDAKWLTVVLEQIIFNSIKYSQAHQQITISNQKNHLWIQDQGLGIASSDLPRIFEPGFTGNNGRKQQNATGMGLYISQQICQRLNIDLVITSTIGQGTRVTLVFPNDQVH